MNKAVPAWLEAGRKGDQHIGISDWRVSDPDFARAIFRSENPGPFAWNFHSNSHLNNLLMEGRVTIDPKKRCAIYEAVQKSIIEEAMIKPLNLSSAVLVVRGEVKGLKLDNLRPAFFWAFDVYLEK